MMKEKRKGLLQRGIMVAVSALTIVAGAGTALAYEAMPSSDESFSDVILDDSLNDFGDHSLNDDLIRSLDFSESDTIYIDSDGIQTTEDDLSSSYALCTHSMADSSFTLMPKIHLVDVLLKYIHVKNVKNVDIELMLFYIVQQLMQNALIN